jgi:phosphopantothenoylcysteine decarboxylase / phosphopantothenate---cysteine ligase
VTTVALPVPPGRVEVVPVETAAQMQAACEAHFPATDVLVMSAAVADFRPVAPPTGKIKKEGGVPEIRLEPTPDILAGLGAAKQPGQILVGFAAETADLRANAAGKLARKRLDLIVANDVSAPGVGFEHDTNAVLLLGDGIEQTVPLAGKREIASRLFDTVVQLRNRAASRPGA